MTFLISVRVLLSVSASVIQKRLVSSGESALRFWVTTYWLMLPLSLGAAMVSWTRPPASFWSDSLLGGVLDALGNLAMIAALRGADLSVYGPLNAIRPILALVFGWLFLNEAPTAAGLAGILITVAGAWVVLEDRAPEAKRSSIWAVLGFRLLGFALATFASVFLKRAASTVSAEMTLAGWVISGVICLTIYGRFHTAKPTAESDRPWLISHALTFIVMQWLTIKIFQATLLSYAFVFFQLAMVLQVIAGRVFFQEPQFGRRLFGCCVMGVGAALILWRG